METHRLERWRDGAMAAIDVTLQEREGYPVRAELDRTKRIG